MEPNRRMLPPGTSAVTIEVSLNHQRKDLPADSISAIQVKHDASVSMTLPLFNHPRYRSEAFVFLSSTPPSALETKFVNSLEHIPSASTIESRGSEFSRGALKWNGEECNQCASDQSKKLNGGVNHKSNEPQTAQHRRLKLSSIGCGSEEKTLKKQNALDRDTKRHCSPLRRQCRVQFENESVPINDPPTTDDCLVESSPESRASSIQADTQVGDCRGGPPHGNWNPINELRKFIEEEKEQQNLPNDVSSKELCEQLETSTDSVESGSEINPLWVLDSITASVEKCNYSAYDTIFEEGIEGEIGLDGPSDGIAQNTCFGEAETEEISGASVDGRTVPQNPEEEEENKRLSQGSDGSFGFEPHYEEDFSGYVEGREYFKNLPTFHRLLTSAEKEELDDEQMQRNELAALRLEEQIPGLHEQSDYAQDMMDTHAMRSEYWDYPYPSQSDAFDGAMRSEDKNELLENMRMKVRGRLRQPGNSSSDSGCQDTDVNHSSIDESDATHRIHSPKGRYQEIIEEDKTQTHGNTNDDSADFGEEREQEKVEIPDEKEAYSPEHPSSHRRQILEGLRRLIASSEETSCSLPIPEDGNLESGTQKRKSFIGSRVINEAPTIPARPMTHGQLTFVHYENITIVKKRIDEDRNTHEDNNMHLNTPSNKQSADFMGDNESAKTETDKRLEHTINGESVAEPIDIDLSDPEVLEATKRMQLAFRKRRGPHGSKKFRSLQRMRAESDSVSDRGLGLDNSKSLDKRNPFPGDISMERCKVPTSRHHSLPPNFMHSLSECNLKGDEPLSTTLKNNDMTKERMCKKLSRQKSVSQYQSFPPSLTEKREGILTECELVNQAGNETTLKKENIEIENQSLVVSERADGQELSEHRCNPSSANVTEMVKPNDILAETAEGKDVDEKLKCILGSEPTNTSQCAQTESVCDALQEPDIDLKDPKLEDASKMIQQVFRRKKLLSKRSRGSVEEKACKKVQANKFSSGNVSFPDIALSEETPNALASENALNPSILYSDTTVNVVIAEFDLDKHTNSNEQQHMNQTKNTPTDNGIEPNETLSVMTPAPINYQTYKGVMIVDDKLSNRLETDSKAPSSDGESVIHADANANIRLSFEKSHGVKRASSIREASLGDEIDIDLLDAEVQAVTEKLRSVSFVEKSPNDARIQDHASPNDTDLELKKEGAGNEISSNGPQSLTELARQSQVKEKVSEKSKTNGDIDLDLSDPDVQKTTFKLQSAFWKKITSSKNKSQNTSTKEDMCRNSESGSKNMPTGATMKNKNGSLIKNRNGKGESIRDQSNHNELIKGTGESLNEESEPKRTLPSSLKHREQDKTCHSATNNDKTRTRPQSSNTNTVNLVSTSSKQTEEIDIDLNDTKVKEATRKIQNLFKRKRTPKKTTETAGKGESKKSIARLKSNAAISLGSKHQTKPMISTSFLDRGENERKETKAPMVSPECHGNTDGDEEMKRSSNRCGVGEPEKTNDGLKEDSKISDPRGTPDEQTELSRIREGNPLSSIDEHVSSKFESTSDEHTTPSIQRDDGRSTLGEDVSNSSHSDPHQSDLDKGAKGDKFSLDNNGSRPVSSIHYANIDPSPMPPTSSTASLLRMQDEVDIDNLMTMSTTTRETNGYVKNNSPVTCSVTSLTTAPLHRRNQDRDDEVDSLKLKSTSTIGNSGKAVHGYLDQASDDTEYETAYSDFSDRVDDELERTLVQEDVMSTELTQMETTIHHHSPRFLIRPKNVTCYHGDRARFVCCITGSPRPDISWFASGKVVRPERDNRLQVTDYSEDENGNRGTNACALVSILEIVEVKFSDKGEYACVAINSQGQAFSSAHLEVETPDLGPPEEPMIDGNDRLSGETNDERSIRENVNAESRLQDLVHISSSSLPRQKVQALVGSNASFFCPVEGDPLPDVKWFKDDIPITCSHGDDRIAIRVEGCIHCLHIRDILVSDAGTYVCSAANDRGTVLCVSLLEVQEFSGSTEGNQQVKQRTPMLVITEPEVFRQTTSEPSFLVSLQSNNEATVVALDSSNAPNNDIPNHCSNTVSDEDAVKILKDDEIEDNPQTNANSGVVVDGSTDEILSSVISTYGPRDPSQNNCDDRVGVLSNDGLTSKESNSSENYASAEAPPCDDAQQAKNKVPNGTIPSEGDSLTEMKHPKSSKRRSLRRNHVKSPTKNNNHSASPGDKDIIEDIGLDDVNGLTRSKSSRKKRSSSSRRKKSPIHYKNVERVRLDLEKAEELTEKVDSCLDIIDDLLTLTSYDENENETEEKLRQKLDTLVHKFADSESDAASMSSRRSTPSHRRKEKLRKVDLLNMSDSNGECLDGSDVNLNVSRIHSDGNIWGPCSLEDSLKVMSELVGNISVTVRDPGLEIGVTAQANSAEPIVHDREENLNNNNNIHCKGRSNTGRINGQNVKRTPLRELLKHSLFSQEVITTRVRRRPLPVTRSLDSVDDITHVPRSSDGRRRHSFGSLYAPRTTRPSRHPLLRTLSIKRRNRAHSAESSSSDDDNPGRFRGMNIARRPKSFDTGHTSYDCPSHAESSDSLPVEQDDKFQQFPDGDRLSSPIGSEDSDCSLEDHNLPDPNITMRLVEDGSFITNTGRFLSEYANVHSLPELLKDNVKDESVSANQRRKNSVGQSANEISKQCTDTEYDSQHKNTVENSSKAVCITGHHVSHNGTSKHRVPQAINSNIHDRDVDDEDDHPDTLLNVSRNDSGFSSSVSPLSTDR